MLFSSIHSLELASRSRCRGRPALREQGRGLAAVDLREHLRAEAARLDLGRPNPPALDQIDGWVGRARRKAGVVATPADKFADGAVLADLVAVLSRRDRPAQRLPRDQRWEMR